MLPAGNRVASSQIAQKRTGTCRAAIIHEEAGEYLDALKARFPGVEFFVCEDDESGAGVPRLEPEVVFSWKTKVISPHIQRSIMSGPSVQWVQVAGAGFEHLLPLSQSIVVTNCSGVCSEFMAETVLGAILMWNFGFPRCIEQQRNAVWRQFLWTPLSRKTVLIIGLGKIGTAVARYSKGLGMRVLGIRSNPAGLESVDQVLGPEKLCEVLPQADYVCVHVPLTDRTRHLLSHAEFKRLKPGAVLINTSRGGVVDEQAMADALTDGRLAGAYADVFETEPLPPDSPLWYLPNLLISPHVSDSVVDWAQRFVDFFADNLARWLDGRDLINRVDIDRGY